LDRRENDLGAVAVGFVQSDLFTDAAIDGNTAMLANPPARLTSRSNCFPDRPVRVEQFFQLAEIAGWREQNAIDRSDRRLLLGVEGAE
jgi:hypothetical protein